MTWELLPCPFCGESHDIEFTEDNRARYVRCLICLMKGPMRYDADSAIKAWNKRADPDTSAEAIGWQLAKLQGMVAKLIEERDELKRRVGE